MNPLDLFFVFAFALTIAMVAQAFFKENPAVLPAFHQFDYLRLLNVADAITMLLTLCGLFAVVKQYSKSCVATLQTSMVPDEDVKLGELRDATADHRCYLKNVGAGRATIGTVRYRLVLSDDERESEDFDLDHFQLMDRLKLKGLQDSKDFYMPRLAEHATFLAPDSKYLIHISNQRFGQVVKYLDIRIIYEDILGGRFLKEFPILYHFRFDI